MTVRYLRHVVIGDPDDPWRRTWGHQPVENQGGSTLVLSWRACFRSGGCE